jgi:hypothetical protein
MWAEPISRGQYGWMVGTSIVAGGVYLWPEYLLTYAGTQGVYTLATMTGLAILLGVLKTQIALNADRPTYGLALQTILPVIGPAVLLPLTAGLSLLLDGFTLLLYALMLHSFFYPRTPIIVVEIAIAMVAGWIAIRTLSAVARSVQFWFPVILLLFVLIVTLTLPFARFPRALTIPSHFRVDSWLNTLAGTWYLFSNAEVVPTLATHVKWPHRAQASWTVVYAVLGQAVILLVLYLVAVVTLGPDAVSRLYWPLVYIFSLVSIRLFFVRGIGIFVLIFWTSTVVLYLTVREFSWSWNATSLIPDLPAIWRTGAVALMLTAVVAIGMMVPSVVTARILLFQWVSPALLLLESTTVPLLWLCSRRLSQKRAAVG